MTCYLAIAFSHHQSLLVGSDHLSWDQSFTICIHFESIGSDTTCHGIRASPIVPTLKRLALIPLVTGRAERRWRGGSETLISPLEAHPCGPGSNPIESQSAFFHFRTFLTLTTPREVHLQVLSSTGQRVTIPCDNTITPHPATNPRRPYIKRCIRHVNCIDHVACFPHVSLMSMSRHSDPTHHRFTHTSVGHSFSVHDSPHPQAIHASSLTCMSPKPWRHIYSECPT